MKREFTALNKQDKGWWIGWVEEVPGVKPPQSHPRRHQSHPKAIW
jgi:hypothetical protein